MENEESANIDSEEANISEGAPIKEAIPEKTLTVSRVNEIVKREKAAAADKARRELEKEIELLKSQAPKSMGGIETNNESLIDTIKQTLATEIRDYQDKESQSQHQKEMEKVANQYYSKMSAGKELYDDFENITKSFNPASFPQVVFLANEADNTPALIYELSQNPQKLATLDYMAQRDPEAARAMLAKLSSSIKGNEDAKATAVNAQDPLSRLKPSTVGSDNGNMTVKDYKGASWLKG